MIITALCCDVFCHAGGLLMPMFLYAILALPQKQTFDHKTKNAVPVMKKKRWEGNTLMGTNGGIQG